jgi:hypothetical protein
VSMFQESCKLLNSFLSGVSGFSNSSLCFATKSNRFSEQNYSAMMELFFSSTMKLNDFDFSLLISFSLFSARGWEFNICSHVNKGIKGSVFDGILNKNHYFLKLSFDTFLPSEFQAIE